MTRVCFLSSAHPKFDKRVFKKEAVYLAAHGYNVVHICPDDVGDEIEREGVHISTYTRRTGLIGRLLNLPRLVSMARRSKADILHANELDSWIAALLAKALTGQRVVFDVHEFYPSMFAETRMPGFLSTLGRGGIRALYWLLAPRTDLIVLANRHIQTDFPDMQGRIICAENFADLNAAHRMDKMTSRSADNGRFEVIHVGLMAKERGSLEIIEAARAHLDNDTRFTLIGTITDMPNDDFRKMLSAGGLQERVRVIDWLPYDDLTEQLVASHLGIVFFQSGSETNALGLPHKLFDYMAAGLPVLVSKHARYVSEIVTEAQCGIIVDSEDPEDIARAIRDLSKDRARARALGESGRRALQEKFNWDTEFSKILKGYEGLI